MKLGLNDQRQLNAAEGWLELGDWVQANEELELITPEMRAHPSVLRASWGIYAKGGKWELAAEVAQGITVILPDNAWGYIHFAYSLHELKRTKEAQAVLLPVADKFPDQYIIRYNLACYCCQLGELKDGLRWLGKAIDLAGKKHIRTMALEDSDLKPLWKQISEI
jgi:tetratricopeptide (TPR) repeat protein